MVSPRDISVPAPYIVSPTNKFDGDDGSWATFFIEVGTPPQAFRVLPSTVGQDIWIPAPQGCMGPYTNLSDCGTLRGVQDFQNAPSRGFLSNDSSTWQFLGLDVLTTETNLFGSNSAIYGTDTVALSTLPGSTYGPQITDQTVGTYSTQDFWVGEIGLGTSDHVSTTHPTPIHSLLVSMKAQNLTASLSYGYTAGQAYASPPVPGSLVLGGYDKARLSSNAISVPVNHSLPEQSLMLSLNSIVAFNTLDGAVQALLNSTVPVNIDSSVSQLWLPEDVCDQFAQVFGLGYDSRTDLYTVNDTIHSQLLSNDPSVSLTLGPIGSGNSISINMHYSAFDLNASIPLYNLSTPYFPIRRATNSSQYTLGRAFLQEAYIVVDWERGNFTVGQAIPQTTTSDVKSILPYSDGGTAVSGSGNATGTSSPSSSGGHSKSSGLSGGAIAGIVIAILAIAAIIIGVFFFRRSRKRKQDREKNGYTAAPAEAVENNTHDDDRPVQEHYPPEKFGEKHDQPFLQHDHAAASPSMDHEPIYEMQGNLPAELNSGGVAAGGVGVHASRSIGGQNRELMSNPIMELPGSAVGSELDVSRTEQQRGHRTTGSAARVSSPLASPHSETMPSEPRMEASPVGSPPLGSPTVGSPNLGPSPLASPPLGSPTLSTEHVDSMGQHDTTTTTTHTHTTHHF